MPPRGPVGGAGKDAERHKQRREQYKRKMGLGESASQGASEARDPQAAPKGVPSGEMRALQLNRPDRGLRNGTILKYPHDPSEPPPQSHVLTPHKGHTIYTGGRARYMWTPRASSHPKNADEALDMLSEMGERLY